MFKGPEGALDVFNSQCLRRICGNTTVMHKQKANLVQYLKLVLCKCSLRLLIYVDKTYKVPECWKLHFWAPWFHNFVGENAWSPLKGRMGRIHKDPPPPNLLGGTSWPHNWTQVHVPTRSGVARYNSTSYKPIFASAFFSNRLYCYQSFIPCSTLSYIVSTTTSIAASARCCWTRVAYHNKPYWEPRLGSFHEIAGFVREGKPENSKKNTCGKGEDQQQTQPTMKGEPEHSHIKIAWIEILIRSS